MVHAAALDAQTEGSRPSGMEFQFTQRDFSRVRSMILERAGIALAPHKQSMVYSRLAKRVRSLGFHSFREYLDHLDAGECAEWESFTNALTTNLTSFFREPHHFEILSHYMRHVVQRKGNMTIWCCASSTGEEPYTIAMTALDTFASDTPPVRIVASDIDTQVLAAAQRGIYKMEAVESLDRSLLKRHFLKGRDAQEGYVRVKPALQRLVSFTKVNLLDPTWPVTGPFDAIFCRNVMIYFERDVQLRILQRFAPMLSPRGLLFAGHSENFSEARTLFELRGKTVYQCLTAGEQDAT